MPHHPSEAVIIRPRQRFMGVGVDGSPIYRRPRHGSKTKSGEPERLVLEDNIPALPKEQSTFDLFPRVGIPISCICFAPELSATVSIDLSCNIFIYLQQFFL